MVFTDGEATCNIFWKVGSSATLGTGTGFEGNILALASITANTGANVEGRLPASTGAVTLDTNTMTGPYCVTPVYSDGDGGGDGDDETGATGGSDESTDGPL